MNADYLSRIATYTESNLPDLDEVVLASLQYFSKTPVPKILTKSYARPLVIGSVNALSTGRIIFSETDAVFAEESTYREAFARVPQIDAVYVISASGGKHAVGIAEEAQTRGLPVFLLTSNREAPAASFVDSEHVLVFPHIREPYTYNTSTYMGMLLGNSNESPEEILSFIETNVMPVLPQDFSAYHSFILTLPPKFGLLRSMFETKFDELFGSYRYGRVFTSEEIKHAKTVVPHDAECFIHFGVEDTNFRTDTTRVFIPLPDTCGPVALLAIGYFIIGHIQKQNHPYFKENIAAYVDGAEKMFEQSLGVIVE